jgi:hypothetical protein
MKTRSTALWAIALLATASGCHRAPRPDVVGSTNAQTQDLALDGEAFYWLKRGDTSRGKSVAEGAVMTMAKGGGAAQTLVSGQFLADHIAIDATDIFWSHSRSAPGNVHNILSRVAKKGGPVADLLDSDRSIEALAVDASSIFVAAGQSGGRILKLDKAGGTPLELAVEQSNPRALLVDGSNVYWITIDGASARAVHKVAKTGGASVTLAPGGDIEQLATDGTNLYFAEGSTLKSVPIAGGSAVTVIDHIVSFGVDGSTVYVVPANDIYLMKLERGASKPTPVAYDPGSFSRGFVFDSNSMYWSSPVDQQIRRSAK